MANDQRERNEEETNLGSGEILGEDGTDLGPDRGAGVHYQGNQNVDISFDRVRNSSVARGDDNFK